MYIAIKISFFNYRLVITNMRYSWIGIRTHKVHLGVLVFIIYYILLVRYTIIILKKQLQTKIEGL